MTQGILDYLCFFLACLDYNNLRFRHIVYLFYWKRKPHENVDFCHEQNLGNISRWCHNMKYVYKRKMEGKSLKGYLNMTDEQAQELKDLGFEFAMADRKPRKSFQERLVELKAFIDANGHANVPSNYVQDPSLRHWASDVRRGSYSLTSEQIETLTDMGFEFTVKSRG